MTLHACTLNKLKIKTEPDSVAHYFLPTEKEDLFMNDLLGKKISLQFTGELHCKYCKKTLKKTFAQGYCYPCFKSLPETDLCQVRPETCHFAQGTCRDPEWGKKNCFISHTVYLANSTGLKVGITRGHNEKKRWLDQGAIQGLPIARVTKRIDAGIIESSLKKHVNDKTNWRKLLKEDAQPLDLEAKRKELVPLIPEQYTCDTLLDEDVREFSYPIHKYPRKIIVFDFLKTSKIEGTLIGMKGQYLLFEEGALNVRKFGGFSIEFQIQ